MRRLASLIWIILISFCGSSLVVADKAKQASNLKARYLYQFIAFAEWPTQTEVEPNTALSNTAPSNTVSSNVETKAPTTEPLKAKNAIKNTSQPNSTQAPLASQQKSDSKPTPSLPKKSNSSSERSNSSLQDGIEDKDAIGNKSTIRYYKIGVLGNDAIVELYDSSVHKPIRGREIKAIKIEQDLSAQFLSQFDLIFIQLNDPAKIKKISVAIQGLPIVTVSENDTNNLCMINFVRKDNKLRFTINDTMAKSVGIKFRSQLLRVALQVI